MLIDNSTMIKNFGKHFGKKPLIKYITGRKFINYMTSCRGRKIKVDCKFSKEFKKEALQLMSDKRLNRVTKELGIKPEALEILKKNAKGEELSKPETQFEHIVLLGAIL